MKKFDYVIVGGGIAGTTAAETIRKNDPVGSIVIISDEPYRLYSKIMLSKPDFFLGKIPFDKIWMKDETWYGDNNIEFLGNKKAIALDGANKILSLNDGNKLGYNKLLLATGVDARCWDVLGADKKRIFNLRTLDNGKAIIEATKSAKQTVIIGSGFVSFEMADALRLAGKDVTLVMLESYYWEPILDEPSGQIVEEALKKAGVKILHNSEVQEVLGNENVEGVVLKNGTKIICDMIVCGIGVVCRNDWLKNSGVELKRGILANKYLETSLPNVWTAGDIAEFYDPILEEVVQLGNWINAQQQGSTVGLNMTGEKKSFRYVSSYTAHSFDVSIAFVGDVRPIEGREIILRHSLTTDSYARLIVLNNELIGAILVNMADQLNIISKLIENDVNVSEKHRELSDLNFDLKTLLNGK